MGANNYFKPGDWNVVCGECGDWWKASQVKKRWDGIWACRFCWEPRHPQDFLRGVKDDQATPWSNPEPPPIWVARDEDLESQGQRLIDGNFLNGNTVG